MPDSTSLQLLNVIIEDNPQELYSIFSDTGQINDGFEITSCEIPSILKSLPPIISVAAFFGSVECVSALIALNANVYEKDNEKRTPSHFAAAGGKLEIIRILDQDEPDTNKNYPIHYAAQYGQVDAIRYFWSKNRNLNETGFKLKQAIHFACYNGHLPVVEFLYDQGCELEVTDEDGYTPLMYACMGGHLNIVEFLIDKNVDVNKTSLEGYSSIVLAAQNGYLSVVKLLVNKNAIYKYLKRKYTPLVESAGGGHLDIVKYFYNLGVDLDIKTSDGVTPLMAAVLKGRYPVVKYLIKHGAQYPTNNPDNPLYLIACCNNYTDIFRFFFEKGFFTTSDFSPEIISDCIINCSCDMLKYMSSIGFNLMGSFSIPDFFRFANTIEKMYLFTQLTDQAGSTKFGVCIDYAFALGMKQILQFFIDEYKYDFSSIKYNQEIPKLKPTNLKEASMMIFNFMLENGGDKPDQNGQSAAGYFAIKTHNLEMIEICFAKGAAICPNNLLVENIISAAINKHKDSLLDKILSLDIDLNNVKLDSNQVEESTCPMLPLYSCTKALARYYPSTIGALPRTVEEDEKNYLLITIEKLLQHGAQFISERCCNLGLAIPINSEELFHLVEKYAKPTKELIVKYDLLARCVYNYSKRYFDYFLTFDPPIIPSNPPQTRPFFRGNSFPSVFFSFRDRLAPELSLYFLKTLLKRLDKIETREDIIYALLFVGSLDLLKMAHEKGVSFDSDETFEVVGDVAQYLKPNILEYIMENGFDPSRKAVMKKSDELLGVFEFMLQKKNTPTREVFNMLVDHGAEVNESLIYLAFDRSNYIFACFLVDAGAKLKNLNQITKIFQTPDSLYFFSRLVANGMEFEEEHLKLAITDRNRFLTRFMYNQGVRLSKSDPASKMLTMTLNQIGFDSNFIKNIFE